MRKTINSPRLATAGADLSCQPILIQRILVVHDDPFYCYRNAEVLIRHGYEVNTAEDCEAGWEELQTNRYHLLITGNEQPTLTGIGLVKKMRSARMTLPVILVTEKLPKAPPAHQLRLHPLVTLLKPYTPEEILVAVRVVLVASRIYDNEIAPQIGQPLQPAIGLRL